MMIEREKKVLLTQQEYLALLRCYHLVGGACQTNHYYDTEDYAFNRRGVTCRIREKNGVYIATKKRHTHGSDASEEISMTVHCTPERFPLGNTTAAYKGSLTTKRSKLESNGVDICLDKNSYLGKEDYELELEYCPGKEDIARKLITDISDVFVKNGLIPSRKVFLERIGKGGSKSERFFERLRKYNGPSQEET